MRSFRLVGLVVLLLLSLIPSSFPTEKESEIKRLNDQFDGLFEAEKYDQALALAEETVRTAQQTLAPDHPDYATSLHNLAQMFFVSGQYEGAEPLLLQVLEIRKTASGERDPDYVRTLSDLAFLYFSMKQPERAVTLAQQVLDIQKRDPGEASADYADTLNFLALFYWSTNDRQRAVAAWGNVVQIRKRALGEEHPAYLESLLSLSRAYSTSGQYLEAEPLLREALALAKKVLGEEDTVHAMILNNLAAVYESMGDYARAMQLLLQSTEVMKRVWGADDPVYAKSLNNLAHIHLLMGDLKASEPLYRDALEIGKQAMPEEHRPYAQSLLGLAHLLMLKGDFNAAESLYLEAQELQKQRLGVEHPDYASVLHNLAMLYREMGDLSQAESLLHRTLEIRKHTIGEQHPDYGGSLHNLAFVYQSMGEYARARLLYDQALQVAKQNHGKRHPEYAKGLGSLANYHALIADYAVAESLYVEALDITRETVGEDHPQYAGLLNNLAVLYRYMGDAPRSEALSLQALTIAEEHLGKEHPLYGVGLTNLARTYQSMGDSRQAESLYLEARQILKRRLGIQHPDYAQSVLALADLYRSMTKYEQAERLYNEGIETLRQTLGEQHPSYVSELSNEAKFYDERGDMRRARSLAGGALQTARRNLELASVAQSERQQLGMIRALRFLLDHTLSLEARDSQPSIQAYDGALAWKGAVLARQRLMRIARVDPEVAPILKELRLTTSRLANLAFSTPAPDRHETWQRQIAELSEAKEQLEAELARKSETFRRQQLGDTVTPQELQSQLPGRTALIDFLEYAYVSPPPKTGGKWSAELSLVAFVVRPDQEIVAVDLGPSADIEALVVLWREDYGTGVEGARAVAALREFVWTPLEAHLEGIDTVLVSPDGPLTRFPLGALPGNDPTRYLIEERAVATIPVPRWLGGVADSGSSTRPASLLVLGDVDYEGDPGVASSLGTSRSAARRGADRPLQFARLANTRAEVASVQRSFLEAFPEQEVSLLERDRATEETFRLQASQYRYLHLATHGFFAAADLERVVSSDPTGHLPSLLPGMDNPGAAAVVGFHPGLLSGLALAGANRTPEVERDDGILTALEVATLDLSGTELVVLSACETGLGVETGGEGLLGLQRAFQVAGARTVVASLWNVDDEATRQLMERFYENLWERKLPRLEALREAQLWMLRGESEEQASKRTERDLIPEDDPSGAQATDRSSPYYWAAFVLSGEWR